MASFNSISGPQPPSEEHPHIKIIDGKMVALINEEEEEEAEGKTEESVFTRLEELP